ncbi:FAD-dependent monooxygenase [Streptomyces neyagawaensis]|uniref:FAD-dependent monooxygenase n=1 Tax=Streptomyces neyagawaensis TaxID=42238 RepID=UPI0006E22A10|nr:FAD-dependent monooxygenase [Streptomyces neyagawaensis]MCL6732171.1 FAD-dependent monooxygenase [Streptomyces neyagawaensis]MDE1682334.1 FAD-dependent monooxygenase [Streptomyces neyagawaensis]
MTTHETRPRIAILGGGIGGLAAAAFLHREGLSSTVYEQAPRLGEVGAGLVVAPNAARQLRKLGVLDELRKGAVQLVVGWEFRRWQDGTVLSAEDLAASCERLYGEQTYTVHRADLLAAIQSRVSATSIELGRKCVGVSPRGDALEIDFADGTRAEADIVIGADGVHSVVRGCLFGTSPATYSGICAYRALVPADQAPDFARRAAQTLWIGPGRHLVHYPVSGGRLVNVVAFAPARDYTVESWTATATVGEFLTEFDGWDPRLVDLIRASGTPGRWALLDRAPLPRWTVGGATLLGDAAHPMFPFFAQGAAQAIEDAAVLARCLADGMGNPTAALRRYEVLRIPRTTRLQTVSHGRSHINHLDDGPEQRERDALYAQEDPLVANGWIYGYDPDAELRPAAARRSGCPSTSV